MVGDPNVREDVDKRDDLKGSAAPTPGLTRLDEEREASVADEGGTSGAVVETQDLETLKRLAEELPVAHLEPVDAGRGVRRSPDGKTIVAVAVAAAAGALLLRRWS
jgi:hypothetical protein